MSTTEYPTTLNMSVFAVWRCCCERLATTWNDLDQSDAEAVAEWQQMRASLYESLMHVIMVRNEHDGEVMLFADGPPEALSFFWRYKSGYHGGIIFHPSYRDGEARQIGTWSIHT